MTSAKIIQIDVAPKFRKLGNISGNSVIGGSGDYGFQNLYRQGVGGEVESIKLPANAIAQLGIG